MKLFLKISNLCNHNTSTLQTDGQTTCDRNTALCTKVHHAVKIIRVGGNLTKLWQKQFCLFFRHGVVCDIDMTLCDIEYTLLQQTN